MITQLRRNIFDVCEAVTNLSGKTFYKIAPQGTKLPYMIFFQITGNIDHDSVSEFEEIYLQFNFYDDMGHLTSLESIYEDFITKLTSGSFSLTNYNIISVRRQFYRDGEYDKVAQIISQYRITLEKK